MKESSTPATRMRSVKTTGIKRRRASLNVAAACLLSLIPGLVQRASADTTINTGTIPSNPNSDTFVIPFV